MELNRRGFIGGIGASAAAVGMGGCASESVASAAVEAVDKGIVELPPSAGAEATGEETMKVRFLGTGSACWEREPRTSKIFRRYSSVLIDGRFLIDYTWMTADMVPTGCRPQSILYTHSHGDHYDPTAAVKLGIRDVYLHRSWISDAKADFAKAVAKVGGAMPVFHPLDVGKRFRLGPYEILPLPGNHYTGKWYEQALIYKVTKLCKDGAVRLLYATDTSGLMSAAFFLGCAGKEPITAAIMESTGQPGRKFDGLRISHSTADMVHDIFTSYLKPGKGRAYTPASPDQKVYLTHIGYYEWGQKTFDDTLPKGLAVAHDGLEVAFRPPVEKGVLMLTFDDPNYDRWVEAMPLFKKYRAHASFFPNGPLDDHALAQLKKLKAAGHTVGIHTMHHRDAPQGFEKLGAETYLAQEVKPQLDAYAKIGHAAKAMAYPNNRRTPETDAFLAEKAGIVRFRAGHVVRYDPKGQYPKPDLVRTDEVFFPVAELPKRRVLEGIGIGEAYRTDIDEILACVRRAAARDEVFVTYSHDIRPDAKTINMKTSWLEKILATAYELNMRIIGFDEI